ncbi:hypothetical protein MYAM1_002335 [Malassezia yamatoensis]|uniref:Oxidoreductase n=1 Tax=Malassezia yamatoensis TaxID=253288 RepID=A0AAJ5YUB8_9BASI|nr:hypothetical protein MYAM1_002335 [Malassezia yamatoensis]
MFPIQVALLGYGNSAKTFHLPFLHSLPEYFQLKVVLQRPRSADSNKPDAAKDYPSVEVVPDIDNALKALPSGSLVIVTTSNASHVPFARKALEANMHVLVEKPLAVNEEQVIELEQLARSVGRVCTVYQNRRFDGDYLTLKKLLTTNDPAQIAVLGLPTLIESRFDRFRPIAKGGWREEVSPEQEGGGMLWDLGAHLVDQVVALYGPPETIFGTLQNERGQGPDSVEDDWMAILTYPARQPPVNGSFAKDSRLGGLRVVLGTTCLSTHIDSEQPRFRVEGTLGSFIKKGTDPQEAQLKLGWTPKSHPDAFGSYDESQPESVRFARLTTTQLSQDASASSPPELAVANIPTLPGRYEEIYKNLAMTIEAANSSTSKEDANQAIDQHLYVTLNQVSISTRIIRLIRQSAKEERVLRYEP